MNSHGASRPLFTSSPRPSTMCVCGEIGYAQTTSGRQSATASATAREPSACWSMRDLLEGVADGVKGVGRRGDVAVGDLAAELVADRVRDRVERDDAGERGEAAEQHRVRQRSAEAPERDLGDRKSTRLN